MKQIYTVTGMTCGGCKASVEEALQNLSAVEKAVADLASSQVVLKLSGKISVEKLQEVLPDKYTISEIKSAAMSDEKSEFKQLFPLFLIFGYIIVTSIILNFKPWDTNSFMLDFMGLFYIVFSFFKLLDLKGFPQSFRMYDPLAKVMPIYSWIYPFLEVVLGIMFLMRIEIPLALVVTLIVLGITTIGVTRTLLNKKSIQCACLGTALKLPMTKATFIENSIMIVMAIIMLVKLN
ncbi:cation transporter [Seonamhaeicola sp. MEBiC1930]|uniref:heavy-metal-associated domain-containing protein n=1 Tax=Seonamhaeicola sp. MEBiC01930 TaxID=2976768 RepID=UPI0032500247